MIREHDLLAQLLVEDCAAIGGCVIFRERRFAAGSLVVPGKGDDLIIGLQRGVGRLNLITKKLCMITALDVNWETHRCNDGGCDSEGRLWISTTELNHEKDGGDIYCISPGVSVSRIGEKITIPNGIVWTADQQRLFYTDSMTGYVFSCVYHSLKNKKR